MTATESPPKLKKQKIDLENVCYCQYILPKKNKRCKMMRKKYNKYCSEHMIFNDTNDSSCEKKKRITCPLDPSHTIWENDIKGHMFKCNARPKTRHEPWFQLNYNCSLVGVNDDDFTPQDDDPLTEEKKYIDLVDSKEYQPLSFHVCNHKGLTTQLEQRTFQKHVLQQSSLIGNLKRLHLLSPECFYVEFGCGKGELSRYVNQCILEENRGREDSDSSHYGYGLIDRGTNRLKADSKIVSDSETSSLHPLIKRSKIDIKDLNLDLFLKEVNPTKLVVISKHLCGAATDLTLKSLLNSCIFQNNQFCGVLIAMCCRHLCSYDQLLPQSKKYLYNLGFKSRQSFDTLKKMVSWAIDASKPEATGDEEEMHSSGLNAKERQECGLKARRILDESRAFALKSILGDAFQVEIFWYVTTETTLENVCLSVTKK
ncbi:TRM13 [Candida oxycetoniae]|uniref:tRNA:m(4)X modification enzyme TRM13 n=1 Tax=Candida oxycetoniae TaxID=497107 RepID=A0AAI9WY30_9ASCO|nr:TRM13 [Candida oxycetoniae]KAI3404847.2 TRM13 [Candida oxycetoniae]